MTAKKWPARRPATWAWPRGLRLYASTCYSWKTTPPGQYAAIRGIKAHALDEEFARRYRVQVLIAYGDRYSWWP